MIKQMMMGLIGLALMGCGHMGVGGNREPVSLVRDMNSETVALVAMVGNGQIRTYCTGVWVSESEIMTAGHCVRAASDIALGHDEEEGEEELEGVAVNYIVDKEVEGVDRNPNGMHMSRAVKVDEVHDVALLRVVGGMVPSHKFAVLGDKAPGVGERVHCVGQVKGLYWSYVTGVVSAHREELPSRRKPSAGGVSFRGPFIQVSMPVSFGNSGGGLFNDDGELVGIVSFMGGPPLTSMFVHVDTMRKMLKK
jgi:S1-C subfamily serine protease